MGDCKLKPVMVYQAENPLALKCYGNGSLPVHWHTNSSDWMTGAYFSGIQQDFLGEKVEGILHVSGPPLLYLDDPRQLSRPPPTCCRICIVI